MTKDLLNGIAITILLALSMLLPVVGFVFVLFIPLPLLFYRQKLGRRISVIIPLVAFMVIAIPGGGISADIFFLAELFIIGFLLGECAEKKFSIEKTVLATSGTVLITAFISLFFYSFFTGNGLVPMVSHFVEENLENTISLYKEMNMPEETISLLEEAKPQISYVLARIMPGMIMAFSLFASWVNVLMARVMFPPAIARFESGRLNRWKAPEHLVWAAIAAGLLMFVPALLFKVIGLNVLLVLLVVYFFQGIAIVSFYFEKKNLPGFLKIILYVFITLQQILILFVVGLGFFDVWLDVRKLHPKEPEED